MKPFDLEKALAGAPVMLRNGGKAWVCGKRPEWVTPHIPPGEVDASQIVGWTDSGCCKSWSIDGGNWYNGAENAFDIIGMCPVKEKRWVVVRPITNGVVGLYPTQSDALNAAVAVSEVDSDSWQIIEIEVEV